ncbi:vacuolar ATPase assembly integral membrane protein vma21 [Rhizina undulata]
MATKRIVSTEDVMVKDGVDISKITALSSPSTAPAVPGAVLAKLLFFTLAMVVAPLGSYYLTLWTIFKGNNTFAGATAAIVANIVLVSYVIVAMREDDEENEKEKKSQ